MKRFLRWTKIVFWTAIGAMLVSSLVLVSVFKDKYLNIPQLPYKHNISNEYTLPVKDSIEKSRYSAVRVLSTDLFLRNQSDLSGTYFIANNNYYVITSAHGMLGPCFLTIIVHEESAYHCEELVAYNEKVDYAIMKIGGQIPDRTPIKIPEDLPNKGEWRQSYSILNKIIYTGYPNQIGPLTLKGDVIGYEGSEYVYVFSHAYSGASGSGVFTTSGKYIGLVTAVDLGENMFGPTILENIVLVTPSFKVDWDVVTN
jgi:hypothetical protein